MDRVTVNDMIKILDRPGNKTGGPTGRERILSLGVNGQYLGYIQSVEIVSWGEWAVPDMHLHITTEMKQVENAELISIGCYEDYCERGRCSKCGFSDNTMTANYCSNCGAKFVKKE